MRFQAQATPSSQASLAFVNPNKVHISNAQIPQQMSSHRPNFAQVTRPARDMRSSIVKMGVVVDKQSKTRTEMPTQTIKYTNNIEHQNLSRSVFNLYDKPSLKPHGIPSKSVVDRSVLTLYEQNERNQQIKTPLITDNQNLKHSIFNLYAKLTIPEKPEMAERNYEQSVLNLYLKNEKTNRNRLGRSVFNLFEKPDFPEYLDFDQNTDRSIMSLYLKQAQEQTAKQNDLSRSVFNLYEKPIIPEKKPISDQNFDRSIMNLYLKEELAQKDEKTDENKLSHSMFNLYEKQNFPENQIFEGSNQRSMMNLFENLEQPLNQTKQNNFSRSMFNLYENIQSLPETKMTQNTNERSMMNMYLKKEQSADQMNKENNLSRSIFNLYEEPVFPKQQQEQLEDVSYDRSVMNLYLKEESANQLQKVEKQQLSRSVFNLYDKPVFPEQKEHFEANYDRSMMNLFQKQEVVSNKMPVENNLNHSMFNLYENRTVPLEETIIENSYQRSMMNKFIQNENQNQGMESETEKRLKRSIFNLYEKPTFPQDKQSVEASYDRSVLSLADKNLDQLSDPFDFKVSSLNTENPELNYESSEIKLTQNEIQIFKYLDGALHFNNLKGKVTLMAAGEWVRDKYLNKPSEKLNLVFQANDLDITPMSLATMIQDYEKSNGDIVQFSDESKVIYKPSSKLRPQDISIINLKGQNIQIVKQQGSLLEDARDRDFTMNALYFNLDELKVKDPIGSGLKDIAQRRVETCSPDSLSNDPLRMLRAIRFASAFNYKLSDSIQDEIKDTYVMQPLFDQKVSKRRIGTELNKMLQDRRGGLRAVELMTDLGVIDNYVTQLCNPSSSKSNVPDICFIKDTFTQDAHTLAKLLESTIGETDDKEIFKKMYHLCIFKVFEHEPEALNQALSECQIQKSTKKFVIDNLKKYPPIMKNELRDNSQISEFLTTLAAVERYLDNNVTIIDQKSPQIYQEQYQKFSLNNDDEISQWATDGKSQYGMVNHMDKTIEDIDLYKAYIQGSAQNKMSEEKEDNEEEASREIIMI